MNKNFLKMLVVCVVAGLVFSSCHHLHHHHGHHGHGYHRGGGHYHHHHRGWH